LHPPPNGMQGRVFMAAKETVEEGKTKQNTQPIFFRRWWILLSLVLLLALGIYAVLGKFGRAQMGSTAPERKVVSPAIPVVAVPAKKADFNVYIIGLGAVSPVNTVTLRTRVDGQLMEVLFEEGQTVRSGDLLARIDPRPFEVQLLQAEGQMARDLAQLKNAQVDLERYKVLWGQDSIAEQQVDSQEALIRQLEGTIKTDEGQIQSAKLQLIYSRITAPISGRVGLRLVDPGNIVHATDVNGLAVITQLQPITVIFSIPEDNLPRVLAGLKTGERGGPRSRPPERPGGVGTRLFSAPGPRQARATAEGNDRRLPKNTGADEEPIRGGCRIEGGRAPGRNAAQVHAGARDRRGRAAGAVGARHRRAHRKAGIELFRPLRTVQCTPATGSDGASLRASGEKT
jgi:RND family efflux transporter MFP subunit